MSGDVALRSETFALIKTLEETGAITATSFSCGSVPDITFDRFQAIGVVFSLIHERSKWWTADWAIEGEKRFGEEFAQMAAATGRSERTLLNWIWVAQRVPRSRRREALSFTHHALVAPLEPVEQERWLDRAEAERWSSRDLKTAIDKELETETDGVNGERPDCDAILDELAAEAHEQLLGCGYEDIVLELVVRAPGVEYRIEKGPAS